jgi:hypothetical protein
MKDLGEIMARKGRLVERIAMQRARLADEFVTLSPLFSLADRGVSAVNTIRRHPEWVAMAAGALVVLRPKRSMAWARRAFAAWRTWKWAKVAIINATRLI